MSGRKKRLPARDRTAFLRRLNAAIGGADMSKAELARKITHSGRPATLSEWLPDGKASIPDGETLVMLAKYLPHADWNYIITGVSRPPADEVARAPLVVSQAAKALRKNRTRAKREE